MLSWHYTFNPIQLESVGRFLVALYVHSHRTIQGVDISWHYIFTLIQLVLDWISSWHYTFNLIQLESVGRFIVALYIHSHTTIQGVDISWHYIFTLIQQKLDWISSWHYTFNLIQLESVGRFIVVLYIHCHTTIQGVDALYIVALNIRSHTTKVGLDIIVALHI